MKNRGILWRNGEKMGVSFGWRKGKNDDFAAVFFHEISRTSEFLR